MNSHTFLSSNSNSNSSSNSHIKIIVSGGQTGVDRAALDVAIKLKIAHGGWCPYERIAEDGIIPKLYNLREASAPTLEEKADPDAIYKKRTELNAKDSDGTLIIINADPIGGTLYTVDMLIKYNKPYLIFNLKDNPCVDDIAKWVVENKIGKLNIAGPRESQSPGIYKISSHVIEQLVTHSLINQNQSQQLNNDNSHPLMKNI
jgi:hypothetical protein